MKNIPWAHDKNISKTLSFPWRDAVQEETSPRLKGECIPRNRVPNMQNECFRFQATPDSPRQMGPIAESRNYTRCSARMRVQMRRASYPSVRSATWDSGTAAPLCVLSTGQALEVSTLSSVPVLESCHACAARRIHLCSPRAAQYASTCLGCRGLTHLVPSPRPFERNCPSGIAGWRLRFTRTTCRWVEHE